MNITNSTVMFLYGKYSLSLRYGEPDATVTISTAAETIEECVTEALALARQLGLCDVIDPWHAIEERAAESKARWDETMRSPTKL